jgi:chromosome segregation ATPase
LLLVDAWRKGPTSAKDACARRQREAIAKEKEFRKEGAELQELLDNYKKMRNDFSIKFDENKFNTAETQIINGLKNFIEKLKTSARGELKDLQRLKKEFLARVQPIESQLLPRIKQYREERRKQKETESIREQKETTSRQREATAKAKELEIRKDGQELNKRIKYYKKICNDDNTNDESKFTEETQIINGFKKLIEKLQSAPGEAKDLLEFKREGLKKIQTKQSEVVKMINESRKKRRFRGEDRIIATKNKDKSDFEDLFDEDYEWYKIGYKGTILGVDEDDSDEEQNKVLVQWDPVKNNKGTYVQLPRELVSVKDIKKV